jgi:hypothetical protein
LSRRVSAISIVSARNLRLSLYNSSSVCCFISGFPLCFFNRTIPKQISEVFSVKCDIKANASATQDFSPKPIAKIKRKNDSTKKKCKKFGFLHFGVNYRVNYKCGLLYPTN